MTRSMYPFIETIKIENNQLLHAEQHLKRIQDTCREYYGKAKDTHELSKELDQLSKTIAVKSRLSIYYNLLNHSCKITAYLIRKIENLYLAENNELDYHLKYSNRTYFDRLKKKCGNKNDCIIVKEDRLTDATYANLAFWNGEEWHTPLYPLLKGIKRHALLQKNLIREKDIRLKDINKYEKVSLINAMLELGDSEIITGRILFLSEI